MKYSFEEYLEVFGTESEPHNPILPHEHNLIEHALKLVMLDYEKNLDQKIEVSGGADDWHDGAFITTDEQAKRIAQQARELSQFSDAAEVDYPDTSSDLVGLGSRVVVCQNGYTFPLDIIGFRIGHPTDLIEEATGEHTEALSPEAPLARSIIGLAVGATTKIDLHEVSREIAIVSVDQSAIQQHFTKVR